MSSAWPKWRYVHGSSLSNGPPFSSAQGFMLRVVRSHHQHQFQWIMRLQDLQAQILW